jgi:hypothetical protein
MAWIGTLPIGVLAAAALLLAAPQETQADDRNTTLTIVGMNAAVDTARHADARAWKVRATSGDVAVLQGTPRRLVKVRPGAFVIPGAEIKSGESGWVVLTHAKDVMAVAAKTRLSLPVKAPGTNTTSI